MVLITLAKILKNSVTNTFGLASVELNLTIPNLCALGLMLASLKSLSTTFLTTSTPTAVCPCLWSRRGARSEQGEEHPQLMAAPALTAAQFLVSALLGRAWCQGMLFFCLVLYLTPL